MTSRLGTGKSLTFFNSVAKSWAFYSKLAVYSHLKASQSHLHSKTVIPKYTPQLPSADTHTESDNVNLGFYTYYCTYSLTSVADSDPDPSDPYVFRPPGSGSFYHKAKIVRTTLIPTVLLLLFPFYL